MPNPSWNSSSVLSTPDSVENSTVSEQLSDWFYGTEALLDALPRLWTRSLLYVLISFTTFALPWAMLSHMDETGSARGRIEPKGATQKLDSQAGGSVIAVKVKEGDTVKAGQVLVELESNVLQTQREQALAKLEGLRIELAQQEVFKNQLSLSTRIQEQQNQAQQLEKLAQVEQARQNLDALKTVYNIQNEEKLAKVDQMKRVFESSKAAYELASVRLKGSQEKVPRYKKAFTDGAISQDRFNEVQELAKENEEQLVQAQSQISQAQSSIQEQHSTYERTIHQGDSDIKQAQWRWLEQKRGYQSLIHTGQLALLKSQEQIKDLQTRITDEKSEITQTASQIASLNFQLQQKVVRSPIDGVIFALPVNKPGAVVQPGEMIAQIAPKNTPLVLKAQMPTKDSGFLKLGSPVKIKFDAYPFQNYGIVPGTVTRISPDSKIQQASTGNTETFELEITMQQSYIEAEHKQVSLAPGQTATAEVIVRQQRVIDYMLDPFKKLQKGGLGA